MTVLLTLLITLPLTVFAVLFALSNRQDVSVSLWPLMEDYALPLWLVGLGLMGTGFFMGACFVAFQAQRLRFRLWREKNRADRLEKDLQALKAETEKKSAVIQNPLPLPAAKNIPSLLAGEDKGEGARRLPRI